MRFQITFLINIVAVSVAFFGGFMAHHFGYVFSNIAVIIAMIIAGLGAVYSIGED